MNLFKKGVALAALLLFGASVFAAQPPVFNRMLDNEHDAALRALSDNGKWAVGYGKSLIDELGYSFPILYDVKANSVKKLFTAQEGNNIANMMACDVTDDGSLIVGQFDGKPAIYRTSKGKWEQLPNTDKTHPNGRAVKVTPDGKYVLGHLNDAGEGFLATIGFWDLTSGTPKEVKLENLPLPISLWGTMQSIQQIYPDDMSADGKFILGTVAFSYAGESWTFVYDVDKKSWRGLGLDVVESVNKDKETVYEFFPWPETGDWFLNSGVFQVGSRMIYGAGYNTEDFSDNVYTYDPATKAFSFVPDSGGMEICAADAKGTVYASKTYNGPVRNWWARVGNYWYDWSVITSQVWGLDWQNDMLKDDYGFTGTFVAASADGLTLLANDYSGPYESYIFSLDEDLQVIAPKVDLLGNYTVSPVSGASFSLLKQVSIAFDRSIDVIGNYSDVKLVDENGNVVANSISLARDNADPRVLVATFRNRRLDTGKVYTVVFPANIVAVTGDADRKNREISVSYKGRPQAPVAPLSIAPADGSEISRINANTNPVVITFDSDILPVEGASDMIALYRIDEEGARELICSLSASITGNVMMIYPVMEQQLARGSNYEIVLKAGAVADISGADPNTELVIRYVGSYVPPRVDGSIIFRDDFNAGLSNTNWMLYDGDQNEPADTPFEWGFTEEYPWWWATDDELTGNWAAVSHSMYTEPAQSDDWLVTHRLYIPDDSALLSFKSQSYRAKQDHLKVYVYETSDIYTALTESIVDKIRYYGDLVYDELQTPGASEEDLEGDWKENIVPLAKYAGKDIYIAFLNDNRNQSAVFLDDVEVSRDMKFSLVNLTPATVIAQDEVVVEGILAVESKTDTYKGYEIRLLDADGNEVCSLADPNVTAALGWELEFTMPKALPLRRSKVNNYSIDITIGDQKDRYTLSVMNMAVRTDKKVVIEEYTGQGCPNCPLGHAALEWIEQDFGDQVIPIALHSYPNDRFDTPQANQLCQNLGFQGAPTARINRGDVSSPMDIDSRENYFYKNAETSPKLWYDQVVDELSTLAPANISITNADCNGSYFNIDVDITYALDMENQNVNIFTAICEDKLNGVQDNNRYMVSAPELREWGAGGAYGQSSVQFVYNDVLRVWDGTTINGTGGYLPSSIEGGKVYTLNLSIPFNSRFFTNLQNTTATVMMIDSETGRVINADRMAVFADDSAVDGVLAEDVKVAALNGAVKVSAAGEFEAAVYSVNGECIALASGNAESVIDLNGYNGVAVVLVRTAEGVASFKLFVK